MSIELKIPEVGESVREVQIGRWLKREGDAVSLDENVVELETDKASMELPAPAAGVLGQILKREGERVAVGDVIGYVENDEQVNVSKPAAPSSPAAASRESKEKEGEPTASPAARRALREHGLKASDVAAE